jgi:hypothetical protein
MFTATTVRAGDVLFFFYAHGAAAIKRLMYIVNVDYIQSICTLL